MRHLCQNGGFDPRDIHVGVSRRGAMVIYNSELKSEVAEIETQLKVEPKLLTPLSGSEVTAKEGEQFAETERRCPWLLTPACRVPSATRNYLFPVNVWAWRRLRITRAATLSQLAVRLPVVRSAIVTSSWPHLSADGGFTRD